MLLYLLIAVIILGVIGAELLHLAMPVIKLLYAYVLKRFGLKTIQILAGILVMVLGWLVYRFKLRNQVAYGTIEVLFAGITGVIAARQVNPQRDWSGQFATLVGAVYIVSRGLANIYDGLEKRT